MTDITIPPAALEVGARAVFRTGFDRDPCDDPFDNDRLAFARKYARAAFLAMISEWPKRQVRCSEIDGIIVRKQLILPLTEKTDDQA